MERGRETARLAAVGGGGIAVLRARFALPAGLDALRIALEMRASAVAAGPEAWQTGRVLVHSFDAGGHYLWYWPGDVASLSGDSGWRPFRAIIPLGSELRYADLIVYNGALSGTLGLRSARVTGLVERPAFTAVRLGLPVAWGAVGLWVAVLLIWRSKRRFGAAALVGGALFALVGTSMPQPAFHRLNQPIEATLQSLLAAIAEDAAPAPVMEPAPESADGGSSPAARAAAPRRPDATVMVRPPARDYPFTFKQAGHFVVFVLLGLAAFVAFPGVPAARRLAGLLMFAVVTETLQMFVATRSSTLSDLAVDAAGLLCATGLIVAIRAVKALARALSRRLSRTDAPP